MMIVEIGQQVVGKEGTLGTIFGFRIDPKTQTADQMVIEHGFPVRVQRLAVLGMAVDAEPDMVRVNLDERELEALELYRAQAYHSQEVERGGPVPFNQGPDAMWNYGQPEVPGDRTSDKPPDPAVNESREIPATYPSGMPIAPQDVRPLVVFPETFVWDSQGDKLGQVHTLGVETTTGEPKKLSLKRGLFSQPGLDIPVEWIGRFGPAGIQLNITRDKVQELMKSNQ